MKYYLIALAITGTVFQGCNKYLDKNADPTKRIIASLEDIDRLANDGRSNNETSYNQGTDEYFVPVFKTTFSPEGIEFYKNWNWNVVTPWGLDQEIVTPNYKAIQNANATLGLLEKIKVTDANRALYNKVSGKAHYLRAANYMFLAWTYCKAYHPDQAAKDLGMPIDEDIYFGNKLKRSTLKELYSYILQEAELAYELLELRYPLRDELNKINVMGLLARVHLSMRQYDKAFKYSNELLQYESGLMNYNNPQEVNISSTTPFKNFNIEMLEIITSSNRRTLRDAILRGNDFFIDTNLVASYAPNDLRLPAYFAKQGNYYRHINILYGDERGSNKSNNIMMTDEIYLIRAECYARNGDKTNALKDLNDLLITRFKTGTFVPFTASTPEEALNIILQERKKTLVLRGLRWIDIKRLNLEGRNISITRKVDGITYTLPPNDPRFAVPLHSILVGDYGYQQNPY